MSDLDKVNDVDIDEEGKFKYILVNLQDKNSKASKKIVRGYADKLLHADIFEVLESQLEQLPRLEATCLGGGGIEHDPEEKTLKVFGMSLRYGQADHQITVDILKKQYPDYNVSWSIEYNF